MIALFAGVQLSRTPTQRLKLLHTNAIIREELLKRFGAEAIDTELLRQLKDFGKEDATKISIESVLQDSMEYAKILLQKHWVLMKTTGTKTLYITDNPVALHNWIKRPYRGNLGLKCDGIEVYLPVSSEYVFLFLCPLMATAWHDASITQGNLREAENLTHGISDINDDNVVHINSIQVGSSERFVYSRDDDFDLVREMLREEPHLRLGPRAGLMGKNGEPDPI
jgi:hypothetical protein